MELYIQNIKGKVLLLVICLIFIHPGTANSENDSTFTVRHGNTLYSISQIYDVTISELREWNNLADNTIYPGQVLRIKPPRRKTPTQEIEDLPGDKPSETPPVTRRLTSSMIPYGIQIAALEQQYDRHINMTLSQYLKPGSYLVDVRVEMEPVRQTSAKQTATASSSDYILPGLPYMPEGLAGMGANFQADISGFNNLLANMQLKRLNIIVYTDASYSKPELAFIEHLVRAAAKVEGQRNDRIQVVPQEFPAKVFHTTEADRVQTITLEIPEKQSPLAIPVLIISITVIVILITLLILILFRKE